MAISDQVDYGLRVFKQQIRLKYGCFLSGTKEYGYINIYKQYEIMKDIQGTQQKLLNELLYQQLTFTHPVRNHRESNRFLHSYYSLLCLRILSMLVLMMNPQICSPAAVVKQSIIIEAQTFFFWYYQN
ncbi:Hypothetical_protein [Hexamita inflata]|uniref:Hypothetical_protein n=1 Tax=Hexamita inflata TaxID=28002 RepID=A0AA86TP79_9EUKA|nr:Hypothetical protein HINF_LOCUS11010 [Hexamita inflata]